MDQQVMVNGMSVTSLTGTGGTRTNWSDGATQEYGLQLAAHSAEVAYGGIFANILPREGANRFTGQLFANFATVTVQIGNEFWTGSFRGDRIAQYPAAGLKGPVTGR